MHVRSILAAALIATTIAMPALAQQPGGAPKASATAAPVQPALAQLLGPRVADLNAAGVQKIVARTGKQRRDIQVSTRYGAIYFPWPKNVTPATFDIEVGKGNTATVRASGYSEANQARYAAAFDAVIPEALRLTAEARTRAERPRP